MPDSAPITNHVRGLYDRMEERIMARDQHGASEICYDIVRAGRPLTEMLAQAVRIHGPYTHVPYHERIDDGYINFVNNDHCLLSARATLNLASMMPKGAEGLPYAQTIWYMPTGLDIWNQKVLKAPGHYARGYTPPPGEPPVPVVHWADQQPKNLSGPIRERLDQWMTHVHRGNVEDAYRVFLGLMEDKPNREDVLAELAFAGLIDVQDRAHNNRSYTTGHKAFRARATVELGDAIGWDATGSHDVIYAGALDIAVGPRWYSTYEMACNAVKIHLEGETLSAVPYAGVSDAERALFDNVEPLTRFESEALIEVIIRQPEPGFIEHLANLLKAGKAPRAIVDTLQLGAAQVLLETHGANNFSLSQHCYEYCNTLGWFYDRFKHPQRIKLLFHAAAYLNRAAWHQHYIGELTPARVKAPAAASRLSGSSILANLEAGLVEMDAEAAVGWTQAYIDGGEDRAPLVQRLAFAAARVGNDPHNQEIAQCTLEDYAKNRSWDRERLLLASAQHTAGHRKYGDHLDCSRRFGMAMGLEILQ
jgi:hypothetical protein